MEQRIDKIFVSEGSVIYLSMVLETNTLAITQYRTSLIMSKDRMNRR